LKALAARRHAGNVSALISELAEREVKLAATEAFFKKHGIPPLSDDDVARIEAEWRGEPSAGPRRPAKRQSPLRGRRA